MASGDARLSRSKPPECRNSLWKYRISWRARRLGNGRASLTTRLSASAGKRFEMRWIVNSVGAIVAAADPCVGRSGTELCSTLVGVALQILAGGLTVTGAHAAEAACAARGRLSSAICAGDRESTRSLSESGFRDYLSTILGHDLGSQLRVLADKKRPPGKAAFAQ
jgi:hypothetical protein